ncbi:MAG: hypothetical protein V3V76_01575, partial [Candidatus Adiutricales bacterium]
YVEGYIKGIHPIILEKLRQGFFSVQSDLDLHGLTVSEAEEAVKNSSMKPLGWITGAYCLCTGEG